MFKEVARSRSMGHCQKSEKRLKLRNSKHERDNFEESKSYQRQRSVKSDGRSLYSLIDSASDHKEEVKMAPKPRRYEESKEPFDQDYLCCENFEVDSVGSMFSDKG
jgi:hypothetical protein